MNFFLLIKVFLLPMQSTTVLYVIKINLYVAIIIILGILLFIYFKFFWPQPMARGILVPRVGIKPVPSA